MRPCKQLADFLPGFRPQAIRCSRSYRPDNLRKALVNCSSNAVIDLLHSFDSFTAG